MEPQGNIKKWETRACQFEWQVGGVVRMFTPSHTHQDMADQQEILLSLIRNIGSTIKFPMIVHIGEGVTVSPDAREYARKVEYLTPINAVAIVVTNRIEQLIANTYFILQKPEIPYRAFLSITEAQKWIERFIPSEKEFELISLPRF